MFGIHDYPLFVATGILLNLTPGQDTFYIIGRSIAHGRRAGLASALGISAGAVVHIMAAAFGLSAVLAASATALALVKILGAVYLIWLGTRMLLRKNIPAMAEEISGSKDAGAAFRQGMLTNILNPKVALFFLAFMPQFIDPTSHARTAAFLTLGFTFLTTGTLWCVILALCATRLRYRLNGSGRAASILNRCAGGIFVFLGLKLAASK